MDTAGPYPRRKGRNSRQRLVRAFSCAYRCITHIKTEWSETHAFEFGLPHFDPLAIATMVTVMFVTFIESTGMFLAVGDMVGRPVDRRTLVRGLRVDGLGTLVGGIFNSFPHTSFSQNVGLIGVTGVKSRFVCAMGGLILVTLGLFPKMAQLVASVPPFVLGGAGIVMFGMVAASGIKSLSRVDFTTNPHNLFIVAVSVGLGLVPVVSPKFFAQLPHALSPLLHSGILLASASAVLLNVVFNGVSREPETTCSEADEASSRSASGSASLERRAVDMH